MTVLNHWKYFYLIQEITEMKNNIAVTAAVVASSVAVSLVIHTLFAMRFNQYLPHNTIRWGVYLSETLFDLLGD